MGGKYVAWYVMERQDEEFVPYAFGTIHCPDIGPTKDFGQLFQFRCLFETFVFQDLADMGVKHAIAERFVYQGRMGHGQSAEEINLRLATMKSVLPNLYMVRNTDWKTWFRRITGMDAPDFYRTVTPHQGDAGGIALYGSVKCFGQGN